jgi:hypothetical protein
VADKDVTMDIALEYLWLALAVSFWATVVILGIALVVSRNAVWLRRLAIAITLSFTGIVCLEDLWWSGLIVSLLIGAVAISVILVAKRNALWPRNLAIVATLLFVGILIVQCGVHWWIRYDIAHPTPGTLRGSVHLTV